MLILPIENNENVYGYLVLQSVMTHRAWLTIDKNNLMIIADILAVTMERIRQEKQIHYMAYYDLLTGLPNRTLFKDRLSQAVLRAERKSEILAVLLLDLDAFKNVNDTIGYEGEMHSYWRSPASYASRCVNRIRCPVSVRMSF